MSGSGISLPALRGNHRRQLRTEGGLLAGDESVCSIAELLSAIMNLVCPECGGPMGGRSKGIQMPGTVRKGFASRMGVPSGTRG